MRIVFQFGFVGKLGSGKQWCHGYISQTSLRFLHAPETESIHGPINGTSPIPVRNEEFAKVMGKILRRPTLFTVPEFALRMLPASEASLFWTVYE